MHVLLITPGFPENENDTDCNPPVQEYLQSLLLRYPEVKVSAISIHYPCKKIFYDWKGIKVYSCGGSSSAQPARLFYWLRAIYYSLKINNKSKINIVHSFWLNETALVGTVISFILNIKHINTLMGQDAKKGNKYVRLLPLKRIIKVAVSEFQSQVFFYSAGKKTDYIIPWGIEMNDSGNQKRTYDIIGVGALIPVKNYQLFIEIISQLKKEFPYLNCLLIGDGVQRSELKKQIETSELSENIKLTGHLKREDVLKIMRQSKILLHTSEYESFGYVIAEALISGCFVVSRETGCVKRSEKIFAAENKNEFTVAIMNLLHSQNEYLPVNPYKLNVTVDYYFRLYKSNYGLNE